MISAGIKDFRVLKTTQSGYEGYLRDCYTLLPETRERMMATSITAHWKCAPLPRCDGTAPYLQPFLLAVHSRHCSPDIRET